MGILARLRRRHEPRQPYTPREGEYELIRCADCGQPIYAALTWTRDGPVFRHGTCPAQRP